MIFPDIALWSGYKLGRLINRSNNLPILIYHQVLNKPDKFRGSEPDVYEFEWQMKSISKHFKTFSITDAVNRLKENSLPDNAICITFDDGYKDNISNAQKILLKYNLKATFFIATGYIDDGIMWNDRIIESFKITKNSFFNSKESGLLDYSLTDEKQRIEAAFKMINKFKYSNHRERDISAKNIQKELKVDLDKKFMMNNDDIIQLHSNGMEIGGHTVNHPILACENYDEAFNEVVSGKEYLETLLQSEVTSFAYPNGRKDLDYTDETRSIIEKAGFKCAVSTNQGISNEKCDRFELNRLYINGKNAFEFSAKLLKNCYL